ncbi:hypothetical protein [Actinoplanes sp. NPDC051859]|uniref:hypothetical protein n=1 Tax=Actinoplanes sp. NPDC051859 TaxID=3363909 RepID=UPI003791FB91
MTQPTVNWDTALIAKLSGDMRLTGSKLKSSFGATNIANPPQDIKAGKTASAVSLTAAINTLYRRVGAEEAKFADLLETLSGDMMDGVARISKANAENQDRTEEFLKQLRDTLNLYQSGGSTPPK